MSSKTNREKVIKLHGKNPHCCYCGCLTILVPEGYAATRKPLWDNHATLEHLTNRLHVERGATRRTALACNACNNKKGIEVYLSTPPEVHEANARMVTARRLGQRLMYLTGQIIDIQGLIDAAKESDYMPNTKINKTNNQGISI